MTNKEAKEILESFWCWDRCNEDEAMALTLAIDALAIDTMTERSSQNEDDSISRKAVIDVLHDLNERKFSMFKERYESYLEALADVEDAVTKIHSAHPTETPEQKTEDDDEDDYITLTNNDNDEKITLEKKRILSMREYFHDPSKTIIRYYEGDYKRLIVVKEPLMRIIFRII